MNHVAFRVQSLKKIEASGMKVQYNDQFQGVAVTELRYRKRL